MQTVTESFPFDVFLSHSSKDKAIAREVAYRLRADGLEVWLDEWQIKPGDSIPAKIEEGLEQSRVLILCMSANVFGSDWAYFEAASFRFRDPLNKERRFIPLRLDKAPLKGSLSQFLYINWPTSLGEQEYAKLLEACRPPKKSGEVDAKAAGEQLMEKAVRLDTGNSEILALTFSNDGRRVLTGGVDRAVRLWDMESGRCLRSLKSHRKRISFIDWSKDQRRALICSDDGNATLLDIEGDSVIVDYGKSALSKRQMDCLRLLAGGVPASMMYAGLGLSEVTIRTHLQQLKMKLKVPTRDQIRQIATKFYAAGGDTEYPPIRASPNWVPHLAWEIERSIAISIPNREDDEDRASPALRLCSQYGGLWRANAKTSALWQVRSESPDFPSGSSFYPFVDPPPNSWSCAWSADHRTAIYGSEDGLLRVWDVLQGKVLRIFEGHTHPISSVALNSDQRRTLSGSTDKTVRLWDLQTGQSLCILGGHDQEVIRVMWSLDQSRGFSASRDGQIIIWDLSRLSNSQRQLSGSISKFEKLPETPLAEAPRQVQYTNAKVLLVGDSGVGKSGLSNYLAHRIRVEDDKPIPSTDGAWATRWSLPYTRTKAGVEREIWLWDFAGQVDYRLVHQVFMEETAAAILVFNPQDENPFDGLGRWDRDLQKATHRPFAKLLAAGRVDRGGLTGGVAGIKKFMAERGYLEPLHLTSAKTGEGCDQLREAVVDAINWQIIPETTSPALYQKMKEEILSLRDRGFVLIRLAELKQRLEMTFSGEDFELAELEAVLRLLSSPGMIQRLDFGGFILLRPEVLSRYAAAVVRRVRKNAHELGCIREDELLAGDLDYQDFKRLAREDEAVVLRTLLDTFVSRAWCLRQPWNSTALLTFPSYFRRERGEQPGHPSVLVTYRFEGSQDDIYATLVVLLHHTVAFESTDLWKSAADFKTHTGAALGFTLARESKGTSRLDVYFETKVDTTSRVIFLRYVHDHLSQHAKQVVRLRVYFCMNGKCKRFNQPFADRSTIDEALGPGGQGKVFCPTCGKAIALRDLIEEKFDSTAVKEKVRSMQIEGQTKIDNESRELLAVHHTGFIVAEAGQIYRGYTNSDHGIDGEIEFKDNQSRASGKRLYVQLKSGDSYLKKRQTDGADVFQIKNPRWAVYWQQQAYSVMLVIRTSNGEIRWMDVSAYLKRESSSGREVKQVVFTGERFDVMSVQTWRKKLLKEGIDNAADAP